MASVTMIGLGSMGSALAGCLLANGHAVTVWNRSPDKAVPLVALGATHIADLAGAVARSDLIVVCVMSQQQTRELLAPLGGALSGKTVFDMSTGDAENAAKLAAMLSQAGADCLTGMISAYPSGIGKPETAIITAGSQAAWQRYADLAKQLGGSSQWVSPDPAAIAALFAALFTARQGFMFGMIYGALVCRKAGIPLQAFADQLPGMVGMLENYRAVFAATVPAGDYDNAEASLASYASSLEDALRTFKAAGAPSGLPQLMSDLANAAMRDGYADKQLTALVEHMSK
ncbi:MAG: NAD(P)-dependent oxidoreductase [Rhodobiaceae bacterium]|nr:NAD(P)-dependent oxidoreductase [Rhodobiaceae bacterium]MCC0015294.1 NAD(P)-dependent oxidoreductase [Rhodobiaceae bacterium]MCC0042490.1 NAD(P)-dependent oxidoreductase [Rhodobiaceae bacterium]MCC0053467.1 NAD(P)-dependent oxidoreductase [Rhodobiaceae bacterium]